MQQARVALTWLVRLFLIAVVVQFFFAGAGAFGAESWDLHTSFGYALAVTSLVILLIALIARRSIILTVILVGAMALQIVLAQLDDTSRWLASLHAVNALAVMGIAGALAGHARRGRVRPE